MLAKLTAMKAKITYLSLCTLLLAACQEPQDVQVVNHIQQTPIAQVGTQTIYKEDVDAELRDLPSHLQYLSQNKKARQEILSTLIRRSVLSQQAFALGLDQDALVHRRINRSRDSIMIEALRDWELSQLPKPNPKEIQAYYKKHISHFTIPEQIHARHILVRQKIEAFAILKKLKRKKDDFASFEALHSIDDSNKSRGGDLNWFLHVIMVADFEKVAFALKNTGDISKPVKTQYGWHIIELLGKRPAYKQTLEEANEEILQILRQQALDTWMDGLVKSSQVHIINDNLEPTLQLPSNQP